jgi:predicted PolB exonuclease-like 3'-5' exonuclease
LGKTHLGSGNIDNPPAYLVFDIETIPDAELVRRVQYAGLSLSAEEALAQSQDKSRAGSGAGFLPLTYQLPVALCTAQVDAKYRLLTLRHADSPHFRPRQIALAFWNELEESNATLVSFNGRAFDVPVLELAAFRYGITAPRHFQRGGGKTRYRYGDGHIDVRAVLTNHGAYWFDGGLETCARLLSKSGSSTMAGEDVPAAYRQGRLDLINERCGFDVLDTYFAFIRSRLIIGCIDARQEQGIIAEARTWIETHSRDHPYLLGYLESWAR